MDNEEQQKRAAMNRLHEAYDILPEGICIFADSPEERLIFLNQGALQLFQCGSLADLREKRGDTFASLVRQEDYEPLASLESRWGRREEEDVPQRYFTLECVTAEGHMRAFDASLNRMEIPELGRLLILTLVSQAMRQAAYEIDPITGLPGVHAFFHKALAMAVEKEKDGTFLQMVPVFFNIANFHRYNTREGIERGDVVLRALSGILRRMFPGKLIGHLSADNFAMLADASDAKVRVLHACEQFRRFIKRPGIELKAGLRVYETLPEQGVRHAFDEAKLACDSVKKDATRSYAVYRPEMGKKFVVEEYIREHFDEALKKHYIQVFYQPVMRTMTGKLCGVEALARWESPEHGRLSPADFIGILENTRLIHRLDTYMIESVARRKRELLDAGKTTVPVSFNLSRLDFVLMDPFKVVEHIRKKYDLPYSQLRIEITEDALVEGESLVRDGIERFRAAGYEVWIDDFGSGYSSLNVLKDYAFDELKIDMVFLRPFNEASRKLLRGIISLAKKLGMHTLAEGVETQEQIDFLRRIGCEKLQGYYYGMPMRYEDFCLHAEERGFQIEAPWEEQLLLPAGRVDVMNHEPLAFFYDDQKRLRMLYMNESYQRTLSTAGTRDSERATRNLNSPAYPAFRRIRKLVQKAISSGEWESATYVDNGQYMRVHLRTISAVQGRYIHLALLYNITLKKEEQEETKHLDQLFRNVLQIYDGIYCLHLQQDTMEVLLPLLSEEREGEIKSSSLQLEMFAESYLHPADRTRFRTFLDGMKMKCTRQMKLDTLAEQAATFRLLKSDGRYHWMIFLGVPLFKSDGKDVLLCVSRDFLEGQPGYADFLKHMLEENEMQGAFRPKLSLSEEGTRLFSVLVQQADFKIFWKDRNYRFCGVSRSFLDYYGLTSSEEVCGRTDAEMRWNLEEDTFHLDERLVIEEGHILREGVGHTLVKGIVHTIHAWKFPVYAMGKIVGLVGYFVDVRELPGEAENFLLTEAKSRKEDPLQKQGDMFRFEREAFDHLEAGVLVIDPVTHEVLYANAKACRDAGYPEDAPLRKVKCYVFSHHASVVCEDCRDKQLSARRFAVHLYHNTETGADQVVYETFVFWEGRYCRFTLMIDVGRKGRELEAQKDLMLRESALNDAIRLGISETDPEVGINRMLETAGKRMGAQRVLLFEEKRGSLHLSYEWAARGVAPLKDTMQPIPRQEITPLHDAFMRSSSVGIEDMKEFGREYPAYAPHVPGIVRMVITRLSYKGESEGILVAVNPPKERLFSATMLFQALSRFFTVLQRNRDMRRTLVEAGRIDVMTGLFNRRGLLQFLDQLPGQRLYALVFADLNGLKRVNDTQGHEAGDRLICSASQILCQVPRSEAFRMGGDEFLLMQEIEDEAKVQQTLEALRRDFRASGISMALGAIAVRTPIWNIDAVLAHADRLMYIDKKKHYEHIAPWKTPDHPQDGA